MDDAYKYYQGYLPPQELVDYIDTKDLSGNEVEIFPLDVLNVNDQVIGTAMNKTELISIWNSDSANQAVGKIDGWYGPFHVELLTKLTSGAPLAVHAISSTLQDYFIDSDNVPLIDVDSNTILAQ